MKRIAIAALLCAAGAAWAQATPAGLWKTIDDETQQEKSLVRITDNGGVFTARVEKLLDPTKQDAVCDKCEGDDKGKPILGMAIVRNIKANAKDSTVWDGGEILDPNKGKTYRALLKPIEGGKKLEVRGYIGSPMFGRSQTWLRVE